MRAQTTANVLNQAPTVDLPTMTKKDEGNNRDSADWIAEVSHELRLPIANLRLLVETLLDGAMEDPQTATRMLLRAKGEVDRLQSLVVDLLMVEQVAASRKEVHCQSVSLQERAAYAIETTAKLAAEKKIEVITRIANDYSIYANQEMLNQVLLNLLENAIKFTAPGGSVTVASGSGSGALQISDTGIGIPATEIPKIFERFYRIDRAQSRGSTGLGLSIVKHIADLHGAKINVTSQEGVGSTFTLEFPGPKTGI